MAQSLNFEFSVWHAHRALWGLYLDIQVSLARFHESIYFAALIEANIYESDASRYFY